MVAGVDDFQGFVVHLFAVDRRQPGACFARVVVFARSQTEPYLRQERRRRLTNDYVLHRA